MSRPQRDAHAFRSHTVTLRPIHLLSARRYNTIQHDVPMVKVVTGNADPTR